MIILLLALVVVLLASFLGYVLALKDSESKKEANKVFLSPQAVKHWPLGR